jgi:V/A-type H+-transporting ATPase subunit I
MSVVPMSLVTLTGPLKYFESAIALCVIDQEFHPEAALQYLRDISGISPMQTENPYLPLLRQGERLAASLDISLQFRAFEQIAVSHEGQASYFQALEEKVGTIKQKITDLGQEAAELRTVTAQLQSLLGLTVNLEDLRSMKFIHFRHGHLPRGTYETYRTRITEQENIFFFVTAQKENQIFGIYFSDEKSAQQADDFFHALRFVPVPLDERVSGTAEQSIADLSTQADAAQTAAKTLQNQLISLREQETEQLLSSLSLLRFHSEICELKKLAVRSQEAFYLIGWVPTPELPKLERRINENQSCRLSYSVDHPNNLDCGVPPTKLEHRFFARIFEPILSMYGLPSYQEMDPTIFMAISYCILYGIMFGDVGQGLCLCLLGILLSCYKKYWLGNIIACCGLSGALFGCVYGSVFGFENILPGFKILEGNHVLILLICSIALGILMLGLSMLFNIANGIRQKNWEKILFGPNALAGFLFYLGVIFAAVAPSTLGINVFCPAYVLLVFVLPLLLILFREPLSLWMKHDPSWNKLAVSEILVIGFFELFEVLLSFLTNTLSFLRVGAYAVTHVGLMLVVQMLAGSHSNPIVLILGNAFVLGFEGFLVGIQVLRLEFYELFGRFYTDGGIPYSPRHIQYSAKSKS